METFNTCELFIQACAGLDLQGPYCFSNEAFFVPNDRIFQYLNIPQNSPNLEYKSHLPKNVISISSSMSTTRWRYNQGKCILVYNFVARLKTLYPCVHWIVLNLVT